MNNPGANDPNASNSGMLKPFILIYAAAMAAQMVALAFGRIDPSHSFADIALPSLLFLSAVTIPAIWVGLVLRSRVGFALWPGSGAALGFVKASASAIALGLIVGGLMLLVRQYSLPHLPPEIPAYGFRGVAGGLAVSFGAAVAEEVWFRLGLMTLLVWLFTRASQSREVPPPLVWTVIVISSLAFALMHLPQLLSYGAGTGFAISGTILGNLVVGLLYGWCYWRLGLSSAVLAHFSVDLVIHVLSAM